MLIVSISEWRSERARLGGIARSIESWRSEYFRRLALRRWALYRGMMEEAEAHLREARRLRELIRKYEEMYRAEYERFLRKAYIPAYIERLRSEAESALKRIPILTGRIESLQAELEEARSKLSAEVERLKLKVIGEYVGVEGLTGFDVWYIPELQIYIIAHPKTRAEVRREVKLVLEWTGSIATRGVRGRGSEPVIVEITVVTAVEKWSADMIHEFCKPEGRYDSAVISKLVEMGWGNMLRALVKRGISYIGRDLCIKLRRYPFRIPQYPIAHILCERRSLIPAEGVSFMEYEAAEAEGRVKVIDGIPFVVERRARIYEQDFRLE